MGVKREDLAVGKTFRAKRPKRTHSRELDDRTIIWMDDLKVQYDGPEVRLGQLRPVVSTEKFLRWAGSEAPPEKEAHA